MNHLPQTALVTGVSRGLGRALFVELARRGVAVLGTGRDEAALAETRALAPASAKAQVVVADVADKTTPHRLAALAADLFGPVDLVVNNAATLGPVPLPPLADAACEDLEAALLVNAIAPFRIAKAALGGMLARGRGTLVHVTSDAAVSAYPGWGVYGASKAALDQLARVWTEELRDVGVRVLAVDPGEMDTKMHAEAVPDADRATLAQPDDVARRIVDWLARGDVATGSRLVVGGAEVPS